MHACFLHLPFFKISFNFDAIPQSVARRAGEGIPGTNFLRFSGDLGAVIYNDRNTHRRKRRHMVSHLPHHSVCLSGRLNDPRRIPAFIW